MIVMALPVVSIPFQQFLPERAVRKINMLRVTVAFIACGFLPRRYVDVWRSRFPLLPVIFVFTLLVADIYPGNGIGIRTYWYFPSAMASFVFYLGLAQQFESSSLLGFTDRNSLKVFGEHGLAAASYSFSRVPVFFAG